MITSNQNPRIKLARALLGRPKEREQAGAFLIEGVRLVEEAARAAWPMRYVLYSADLTGRGRELIEALKAAGVDVEETSSSVLQALSDTETSQGLVAVLEVGELPAPEALDFVLILDQVRDPGNLGTLLRTAAAAGAQSVLLAPGTTDAFAPKVLRSAMGAHFRLPIRANTWDEIRRACASGHLQILLADMEGVPCWDTDLKQPVALIVGGEAEGASEEAYKLANQRISIPMPGGGESLNAAVAGSVLMFEVVRQRA